MADFLEKLLSGRYPQIEKMWRVKFDEILDQAFKNIDFDDDAPPISDDVAVSVLRADLLRVESVLEEERSRLEAVRRELAVVSAERDALRYKLDAAKRELLT